LTYHRGRRFTVSQKTCQECKKWAGKKGSGSILELLRVAGPSGSMLEVEPDPIVGDCCSASPGRQRYYFAKRCMSDVRFSTLIGGLKGAAYLLVDRQKILVHPLVLAKITVFFGILSPIIGGQVSSNSLLFGR
jgi:hypothetical protein